MTMYKDLQELTGGVSPFIWGCMLYKVTSCGVWVAFITPEAEHYYEDLEDRQDMDWIGACTGVKIGSIVEGSDVGIEPFTLTFPFTPEELDRNIERVEKAAEFYWVRDNSLWYYLIGEHAATIRQTWGEIIWESGADYIPKVIREKIEKTVSELEDTAVGPGKGDNVTVFEEGGIKLVEFINDISFD